MSYANLSLKSALATLLLVATPVVLRGQGAPVTPSVPRPEEVRQLIATLQAPEKAQQDKVIACHRLAVIGTAEAVPVLASLLSDEKMAHYARHALEPMPDPAAGAALRDALGRLQGRLLIGVINSLGFRRDAQAAAALAKLLAGPDAEVTGAAAAALGRIGTVDAAKQLQATLARATGPLQITLADASLTCAETLVAAGKRSDAAAIFDRLTGSGFPDYLRTAAMCGAITARQDAGIPLLSKQLQGQDKALLAAAWRAARELPGSNVTKALAGELGRLPAEKEVLIVQVLADRADKSALPAVLTAARGKSPEVRVAALQALPRLDDGKSSLPVLMQAVTAGSSPAETDAALASLGQIGGTETNARILAALPGAAPALRVKLIGLLAARRAENARGEMLKLAAGTDPNISKAAFRALAVVARPADLPELIRLSTTCPDDGVKVPADVAVYAVSMKIEPASKRAEPVLAAYRAATDAATRSSLLRPLGAIVKANGGNPQILDTMKAALNDGDARVRETALRSLADWPDAGPAGLLLDLFTREKDPARRELALRGGARMAANVAAGRDASTPLDTVAWFTQANQNIRTTEEKLIIVSGLGSVKRIEGLRMLQPYLDDPSVQAEAALAVLEVAPALAGTEHAAAAKAALDKISASSKDADIRRRAGKATKSIQPKAKK